jgi:DNA-directed RNA polymerase III subunit RPC6
MVYGIIDEAAADGVWNRTIKNKLQMTEQLVKTCIKKLEGLGLIREMQSVEHPNKKMYIKAGLRPSARATGGPWFTNTQLDEVFVNELENVIFEYIKSHSAYQHTVPGRGGGATKTPSKGVVRGEGAVVKTEDGAAAQRAGRKRPAGDISTDDQGVVRSGNQDSGFPAPSHTSTGGGGKHKVYLPMPAGYTDYPTVNEIAQFVHSIKITNNTTLTETDIQQLIDLLIYDGLIEPIRVKKRKGYRVLRALKQDPVSYHERVKERRAKAREDEEEPLEVLAPEPRSNGLTEAPCGQCPVFELCEEGGPVSPSNCIYFPQWLGLEIE